MLILTQESRSFHNAGFIRLINITHTGNACLYQSSADILRRIFSDATEVGRFSFMDVTFLERRKIRAPSKSGEVTTTHAAASRDKSIESLFYYSCGEEILGYWWTQRDEHEYTIDKIGTKQEHTPRPFFKRHSNITFSSQENIKVCGVDQITQCCTEESGSGHILLNLDRVLGLG